MSTEDRMWLGGWIALCLGIAHDKPLLAWLAVWAFGVLIWRRRRADP